MIPTKKYLTVAVILLFALPLCAQHEFGLRLAKAAIGLTARKVIYDPSYFAIPYPNGDVPPDRGVCTDVIIRAYRELGIDLQQAVHEDMKNNFSAYPKNWGLRATDKNIDHRRVPNLMMFFQRHGETLKKSAAPDDYAAGDIVTWDLGNGITHIGIVIDRTFEDHQRKLIVHNIGRGQEIADCLFSFTITGHYRYKP
ncbi:MAG TPA: DUF1287 domain-containing protein [Ohtaekwangia sp.]|nr:DUF1287 domain-containing protein [Ohtaekwangia sp.]